MAMRDHERVRIMAVSYGLFKWKPPGEYPNGGELRGCLDRCSMTEDDRGKNYSWRLWN
jgi:hypothetical protein